MNWEFLPGGGDSEIVSQVDAGHLPEKIHHIAESAQLRRLHWTLPVPVPACQSAGVVFLCDICVAVRE